MTYLPFILTVAYFVVGLVVTWRVGLWDLAEEAESETSPYALLLLVTLAFSVTLWPVAAPAWHRGKRRYRR